MTKYEAKILLFTKTYPSSDDKFFGSELPYLEASFNSVILIPKKLVGTKANIPKHVSIETTLGELMEPNTIIKSTIKTLFFVFTSIEFYKEIIKKPKKTLHFHSVIRLILFLGVAIRTKNWVLEYIARNNLDMAKTIFYTYWLDAETMGICFAKKKYPDIKIISRAHGYDIYDERSTSSYIPYRPEIFENLNKVYTASLDGKEYLSNKNPVYKDIFKVAYLGVKDPGFVTKQSEDDIFRIISCSEIVTVKRIELLIYGLKDLGDHYKDKKFSWIHIGNGPLENKIKKLSRRMLPKNIDYRFLGLIPNADVINFYKNNPIDVFINVSQSEGGFPVSIMEAQSCGIPVIASAVGGNKEIINEKVGILLKADPNPEEISEEIINFMKNPEFIRERKYNSISNFQEKCDANKNYQFFIEELKSLLQ